MDVQKCLKQKLNNRANNFRKRAKKKGLKATIPNMQVASSDDEPKIMQQLTNIFKRYTVMNKENMDLSFRS
ncbi:22327_t:CDS:2, partial [Cetraspora pellucida]